MPAYDSSYLIDQVKRRGSLPTSQSLFTTDKLLLMLNDELKTRITPTMMAAREEWFVTDYDITADGSTKEYSIPVNAIGGKLRGVFIIDTDGRQEKQVPRLDPDQLFDASFGFFVKNNKIIFYPSAISQAKTIRFQYFRRADDLVATSAAGLITSVASGSVDISGTPPTTFSNGASVQIISGNSPFFPVISTTISSVAGSTINVGATTGATVGDWICLAGQSVFPQIPVELIPLLCQATVVRCLEALGDSEGMNSALSNYNQMEIYAKMSFLPRVDSALPKVMNRKRISRFMV
jgi:hypothetical protein